MPDAAPSRDRDGRQALIPVGEVGLLAGGGGGKSRLALQIATTATGADERGGYAPVFRERAPLDALHVRPGPEVMAGYEDAREWIAWRARRLVAPLRAPVVGCLR